MQTTLNCPEGHAWQMEPTAASQAGICPICGAMSLAPADAATIPPRPPEPATVTVHPDAMPLTPPIAADPRESATIAPADVHAVPADRPIVPGYEILAELGRGGMGVVYQARHVKLDRLVALKMILAGGHAGPAEVERFRVEARAIARLQHPNIVQVYEVGERGGLPYFSLEYCAGGTLAQKLAGTPLPPSEAASLVETLARAMQAAHQQGIVHRDLKPANVLLVSTQPKITDFGLARKLDEASQTASGAVMGTPSYMAPEQAGGRAQAIGPACDVYALGAILYECLTGRPPFKAATALDTIMLVVSQEPVPPRQLNANVPRDLETICLKCLHKEPARRYATAAGLADDLQRLQAGEPIQARPVGPAERLGLWARRNPGVALALAAVAFMFAAGTAVSTYFAFDAAAQAEHSRHNEAVAVGARKDVEKVNVELTHANQEIEEANAGLKRSRDELEVMLARSLLRPLGVQGRDTAGASPSLAPPEIEALWELAGQPADQLCYLFVKEAVERPQTIRQLKNRAELALHAATGLSLDRRARLERILIERLADPKLDENHRIDLALVAATLGGLTPPNALLVAGQLTRAMANTHDAKTLLMLAQGLAAVAPHLGREDAARRAGEAVLYLTRPVGKHGSYANDDLLRGLAAVAPWLTSADAARSAAVFIQDMKKIDPVFGTLAFASVVSLEQSDTVTSLAALATRLNAEDSQRIATLITQVMRESSDGNALAVLAHALPAVASRRAPNEAARLYEITATRLADAMQKLEASLDTPTLMRQLGPFALWRLAQSRRAIAERLGPDSTRQHCGQSAVLLARATRKFPEVTSAQTLEKAISAMADRLGPDDAAQTARLLGDTIGKAKNDQLLAASLFPALVAVSPRLGPKDAAATTELLARTFASAKEPLIKMMLAASQLKMSSQLGTADAERTANHFITEALTGSQDMFIMMGLTEGLSTVAAHLEPAAAARCADRLSEAMGKTDKSGSLQSFATGLAGLAHRLAPDEAARRCGTAANRLSAAMASNTAASDRMALARGLAQLAGRLERKDAARVCTQSVTKLAESMAATSDTPTLTGLAESVAELAPWLEPEDAARHRRAAVQVLTRTMHNQADASFRLRGLFKLGLQVEDVPWLADLLLLDIAKSYEAGRQKIATDLTTVLYCLSPATVRERCDAVTLGIGALAGSGPSPSPAPLLIAAEPLPRAVPPQVLVDLLKHPLCVGPARRAVLDHLERHFSRPFADQWAFADFARERQSGLDIAGRPQRSALHAVGERK